MKTAIKFVAILMILGLALGFTAIHPVYAASTLYVATTGNDSNDCLSTGTACLTVEGAVAKAAAGDTINIAAGTYSPPGTIILSKPLTILGSSSGGTIISGPGGSIVKVFELTSSDITLQYLTITLATLPLSTNYDGLINAGDLAISNINILDNEIYVLPQPGPMSSWGARAIQLGRYLTNVTVARNKMYNTRTGFVAGYNASVTLDQNIIYNTKGGIMNYTGSAADAANRVITDNSWNDIHNEWDIVWNSGGGSYVMDMDLYVRQMSIANNDAYVVSQMTTGTLSALTNNRSHVFVATTGTTTLKADNGNINVPYAKIQDGINAVVSGGKVIVAAGSYDEENILISKGLTLLGAGATTTFIAPSTVTNNSTIIVQDPTGNVKIDGFNFIMQPKVNYGSAIVISGTTIPIDSATVTISNNIVTGSDNGANSDYGFYGQGNNAKLVITNNVINKTGDNPIVMENQMGSSIVSNNTFYITANPDYNPYFSMAHSGSSVTTPQIVEANTFHLDHSGTGYSEAITFDTAVNNRWYGVTTDTGYYTDIQIKDNIIYTEGAYARGIGLFDLSSTDGFGTISGTDITGNQIIGESYTDTATFGITLLGDIDGTLIQENSLSNIDLGIWLKSGYNSVYPSLTNIDKNKITSIGTAIKNDGTVMADASPNWFGSASGPILSTLVGPVDYIPWCTNAECTEFGGPVTNVTRHLGYATIQAAIDDAATLPGDVITVAAGTYPEHITISKALTITGANKATTIIDGSGTGIVALITTNNVTLSGFTIQNSGSNPSTDAGIALLGANTSTINGNTVTNNANGIAVMSSTGNTFSNNTISNNLVYGIVLEKYGPLPAFSTGNTITTNTINANGLDGIYAGENNDNNQILSNTITGTTGGLNSGGSVEGNGIYLWKSAANTINGNTISGNNTYGIEMFGSKDNTITHNIVTGNLDGLHIRNIDVVTYPGYSIRGNNISLNQINGNTRVNLYATPNFEFKIESNWWGSPVEAEVVAKLASWDASGNVVPGTTVFLDYSPWCAVPDCSILNPHTVGSEGLQAVLDAAPSYTTIIVPGITYSDGSSIGYHIDTPHLTIILKNGTVIQNNSPCFTVNASYTTITTESIGGAKCIPTGGSNGIDVADGLVNIILKGMEIDGTGQSTGAGISFAGAIEDVQVVDNYIHDLDGDGLLLNAQPAGVVDIKGNLFKANGGLGVNNLNGTSAINATYNSWGSQGGPSTGDGVSDFVTFSPWTNVDLYLNSADSPWEFQVVNGSNITITVKGDLMNVTGASFKLEYDASLLDLVSATPTSLFQPVTEGGSVVNTATDGLVKYDGFNFTAVSGTEQLFYTLVFKGAASGTAYLRFDETTDVFAMSPSAGPSNNVYANTLMDGSVKVIDLPTLTIVPLETCYAGLPCQFQLHITNPANGENPTEPWYLNFSAPTGTILEFNNGSTWDVITSGWVLGGVTPGVTITPTFRATFYTPGSNPMSVFLMDPAPAPDFQLATDDETFAVAGNFSLLGTFSMQGRVFRGGIPVTLTWAGTPAYAPLGTTVDIISKNLSLTLTYGGVYTITTNQPRYLNVTAGLVKTVEITAADTLTSLELKGGNAKWDDNIIDILDAGQIGGEYGSSAPGDGDVNFDGMVNIQDLALVGGNYGATSASAYASWVP